MPANEIVGCGPGDLFVHRNIANLVVNNDNSIQSVFQFAVEYLQVLIFRFRQLALPPPLLLRDGRPQPFAALAILSCFFSLSLCSRTNTRPCLDLHESWWHLIARASGHDVLHALSKPIKYEIVEPILVLRMLAIRSSTSWCIINAHAAKWS